MAISGGRFTRQYQTGLAQKELADKLARQRKREGGLGGFLTLISPLLAMATGGLSTALSMPGGLLGSIGKGLIGAGLKGGAESLARSAGMGADVSEIKAENRYGIGKGSAKQYREAMAQQIKEKSAFNPEGILSNVLMQYIGDLTPKIGKDGLKIEGGDLTKDIREHGFFSKEALVGKGRGDVGLFGKKVGGWEGFKAALGGEEGMEKALSDRLSGLGLDKEGWAITDPTTPSDTTDKWKNVLDYGISEETSLENPSITQAWEAQNKAMKDGVSTEIPGLIGQQNIDPLTGLQKAASTKGMTPTTWGGLTREKYPEIYGTDLPQDALSTEPTGMGFSPEELQQMEGEDWFNQYIQELQQPNPWGNQQKFEQGGLVSGTISDYFEAQGKSLGGSNKKSLSEILGRK